MLRQIIGTELGPGRVHLAWGGGQVYFSVRIFGKWLRIFWARSARFGWLFLPYIKYGR